MITRIASVIFFGFLVWLSDAEDTIRPTKVMGENETLVSAGGVFELGFFEDATSGNRFMGTWLKNDVNKKALWVANRDNPMLSDPSATLQIRDDGNLILLDRRQSPIIVNSGMIARSDNTSATLLDSGNLFLRQGDQVVWQSFDYPTDTFLPGMKIGEFGLTAEVPRNQSLVSWVNPENPLRGAFTLGVQSVDHKAATKLGVWRGYNDHMDISSWDGNNFVFIFKNSTNSFNFVYVYVSNENESYFTFTTIGKYDMSWLVISSIGHIDEYTMFNGSISTVSHSLCDKSIIGNSNVCMDSETSRCTDGDAFMPMNGTLPASMTVDLSVVSTECEFLCKRNCSCIGFATFQDDLAWCQLYYGSKNDILNLTLKEGNGTVYVRGFATYPTGAVKKSLLLVLLSAVCPLIVTMLVALWCYRRGQISSRRGPLCSISILRKRIICYI
ncbi:receptor-like serine/threonine-protein kinase SD1-8 [Coffea arabica]|uniref:Receptor-like serine/threonine-protein kinase SD1-8 n=1 Tax=Coffea arabica TaxID=13443 RepID=A0A6P6TXK1_COFAR